MKKLLPKSVNNPSGFTLIELLTVVAIIAILSVVAFAIFTSTQSRARDGRRRGDIDALQKALEVNRSVAGYIALVGTHFAGGTVPIVDPQTIPYCIILSVPADPAPWTTSGCPLGGWVTVAAVVWPVAPAPLPTQYKVCSIIENTPPLVFCRANAQ